MHTSLAPSGNGYAGWLDKAYDFTFTVPNTSQQTASVTVQLAESGSYGNGDVSWGTKTVTKTIAPGQTGSFPFAGSHSWQWTKHEASIRGTVSDWLSTRTGCADLSTVLSEFGSVLTTADTPLSLAERTKQVFGIADPVHSYTYARGSGTSPGVTFDPVAVKLIASPLRVEALLHALMLGLGAKAWACAGWVPSSQPWDLREATLATSAAYKYYADRLYRAAWEQSAAYTTIPTPVKVEIARLAGVRGATREHLDRLMSVASLQEARLHAMTRAESAMRAGQYVAAIRQLEAAVRWTESIQDMALGIEGLAQSLTADLPATMTRQQHLDFADSIANQGLPGRLAGFLTDLGYTSEDVIELQRSWRIAPSSPQDGGLRASLAALFTAQRSAEASLKDQLRRAMNEAYGHLGVPLSALELTGSMGENGWFRAPPQAKITGAAPGGGSVTLEYRYGTGTWRGYTGQFQVDVSTLQELFTRAAAGSLVQEPPVAWRTRYDQVPPVTTVWNAPSVWLNAPVRLDFSVADALSGPWTSVWSIQQISGGPALATGANRFISMRSEGQWKVNYSSKDVAGNQEAWRSVSVRIDLTPPQSDITDSINKNFVGQVRLDGPATDPMSGVQRVELVFQRIDPFNGAPSGGAFLRTSSVANGAWIFEGSLDAGKYKVWPRAIDLAGNVEENPQSDWIEIVVI